MTSARHLLYLDTSAMMRLYTDEPKRDEVLTEQAAAGGVIAHSITYVEMRAALASRRARKLMSGAAYTQALRAFEGDWAAVANIAVNEDLLKQAGDLAERHQLRAYDAVHLAAAVKIAPLGIRFMTFDQKLQDVADAMLPGKVWRG
ncbi:type II toxin-antitoxin system VapC family toxin [Deinococcus sp.]|uniref:type II toxin-antitoxin system VapC family toxin n=1 Tax=Deinococcus sp. TaxID=47478 RepID=UPI0025BD3605|nr:type II toxin-antitoxin system VapC family toxin [Deinococcus sp.]